MPQYKEYFHYGATVVAEQDDGERPSRQTAITMAAYWQALVEFRFKILYNPNEQ